MLWLKAKLHAIRLRIKLMWLSSSPSPQSKCECVCLHEIRGVATVGIICHTLIYFTIVGLSSIIYRSFTNWFFALARAKPLFLFAMQDPTNCSIITDDKQKKYTHNKQKTIIIWFYLLKGLFELFGCLLLCHSHHLQCTRWLKRSGYKLWLVDEIA